MPLLAVNPYPLKSWPSTAELLAQTQYVICPMQSWLGDGFALCAGDLFHGVKTLYVQT